MMAVAQNRFAVLTAPRAFELRTEPVGPLRPGEALVRIRSCALCTMEQRLWTGARPAYPIAPGHEAAGDVAAVHDDGVVGALAGQRVAIAFLDRCLQCEPCRRGDTNLCLGKFQGRGAGRLRRIGGLSEYAVVPAWKLFALPAARSYDEIALCEPLACVVHSVDGAGLRFGDDVWVAGFGTMGYLHVLLARLRGARVFVSDPLPQRRQLALDIGAAGAWAPGEATTSLMRDSGRSCVDAVFVTGGDRDAVAEAAAMVRPGGRIVYYGSMAEGILPAPDVRRLHEQEIVLTGARGQTLADWQQAVRLVAAGLVDLQPLVSEQYPLAHLADALDHAVAGAYRIVVHP